MEGYDVRTIDGDKIGHVVAVDDEVLIVEHGLLKTKHALPQVLAEVDEGEHVVRTALSKDLIYDSPKVDGEVDHIAVAEHYGLAEGFTDPPTRGLDDLEPDAADQTVHERVRVRKEVSSNEGPFDEAPPSPGVTGGDRRRDYPKD
jgi:hypothetical protein